MKKQKISLGDDELRILKEIYNIDLTQPDSVKAFQGRTLERLKSISELKRKIYVSMYPNRKKRIPSGRKCSFCLRAENEVHGMSKHESGFNLCNTCINTVRKSENE